MTYLEKLVPLWNDMQIDIFQLLDSCFKIGDLNFIALAIICMPWLPNIPHL